MRKADRLFEIIQILRRSKKPVTADAMAVELGDLEALRLSRHRRAARAARAHPRRGRHRLRARQGPRHAAPDADARTRSRRPCWARNG